MSSLSSQDAIYNIHWNKCINNMKHKIKVNGLTNDFIKLLHEQTSIMLCEDPLIYKISDLVDEDGHTGASFACCCHSVWQILLEEQKKEKKRLQATFRGIVKCFIQLKYLRLKAAERIYKPNQIGYFIAKNDFDRLQQKRMPPRPPTLCEESHL